MIDKRELAQRYQVGIRTLENWLAVGVIAGVRRGRALQFDLTDCDDRLFNLQLPGRETEGHPANSIQTGEYLMTRTFTNIAGLARRYAVTSRTIKKWRRIGLLPHFKIGRVVRFCIEDCDDSLRKFGF